jgi:C4-dicarboxylate transporter, DctQ subunit
MKQKKSGKIFDRILDSGAVIAAAMILFAMLAVCVAIGSRAIVGNALTWVGDTCSILLLYITFLGAAWVLRLDEHVRIDTLLNKMNSRQQALMNIITSILGVLMFAAVTVYSALATLTAYREHLWMSTTLQTPKWVILIVIPVGSLLLLIQFVRRVYILIKIRSQMKSPESRISLPEA